MTIRDIHHKTFSLTARRLKLQDCILYLVSILLGVSAIVLTEVKVGQAVLIVVALLAAAFFAARKTGVLKDASSVKGR